MMMTPPKRPMRPMPGRTGPAPKPRGPQVSPPMTMPGRTGPDSRPQVSPPMTGIANTGPGNGTPLVFQRMAKGGKVSPAMKAKAKAKVVKKGTMRKAPSRSR
jgi:hypothetical protein